MLQTLLQLPSHVLYHLWTLFLFTKSDIKTTVIPITLLAVASAPLENIVHLPHVVFWVWFHVLQFDVSNQTLNPAEDEHNKRDRPLPAGRISWKHAKVLRWALVPLCWALSACYSAETVQASVALCILTYVYDEMGAAAGHWLGRNVVNAFGFMSFEVGACLIAGSNRHALDNISGIFATTIQAQDFKDTEGDRLVGRQTLPIIAPATARPTLLLALAAWSVGLSALWGLSTAVSLAFNVLAFAVGGRFVAFHSMKADQHSFYLYNVWLSVAHVLPAYFRFVASAPTF
ncbi:UbiA prenyltransferase family-domain-containing protein [Phellopilus nigrolimitatus]|nr:UbiA prenyltransferase family-domain-containing protein [Phellopilus nigrolimitatus]